MCRRIGSINHFNQFLISQSTLKGPLFYIHISPLCNQKSCVQFRNKATIGSRHLVINQSLCLVWTTWRFNTFHISFFESHITVSQNHLSIGISQISRRFEIITCHHRICCFANAQSILEMQSHELQGQDRWIAHLRAGSQGFRMKQFFKSK